VKAMNYELLHFYGQDVYSLDSSGKVLATLAEQEMGMKKSYEGQNVLYIFKKLP
jgi:hypothetical protein